jgi:Domain of unknown function (DUF1996)
MEASSQRITGQVRLVLMLIVGVAATAACVMTLLWWKAPAASGQDETVPNEESFVVKCDFSHRDQVDPIVDFGNPKSFHMHDFYGNTTTDENSTYDTLRAGGTQPGGTNCDEPGDTAAYWAPTLSWTDSSGTTERTASITRFYYRLGGKSPNVPVNPHPAGLKIVTVQGKNVQWRCMNTGTFSTKPPSRCDNGKLVVRVMFPDCLAVVAGSNPMKPLTDTADDPSRFPTNDHRSHMVDSVRPENALKDKCPSTHPYPVPMLQTNIEFPIPPGTRGKVTLSSGAYTTMHADFFNAWDQTRLEHLVDTCLNNEPFTTTNPKPDECF